ncbi:MAG: flagellar hook-basal body complex protein FliE [Chitinispirillales bacterium]|jgi:flagellar hook-basal body complex protein FliE|nr:flagellar hook-basal body complex protein FliE [Chitinispirillales bacterium]
MEGIESIGPIQGGSFSQRVNPALGQTEGVSFKDTLSGFLKDVDQMQKKADQSIQRLAAGEITDVHQVMSASEEANVAFNMMMEIRTKVMDAYQEIMRIRL